MGIISRKIFPACGNMCVCCPALRSSSRQPVKRYRKLIADIFPKDELPNERKIVKLCEYAARNPFRIPKIAKILEERCYKELRSEHIKLVRIITESFNKLLSICKLQLAYFAVAVLNVIWELLCYSKDDSVRTLGCQTLTRFIYCQVDSTYTHNIEKLVKKVCELAQEHGETHEKRCMRASSLQCLSAMVWFMTEFSHIFVDFDEIVHATLDNYERGRHSEDADFEAEPHHNWVDEVVRCEGRANSIAGTEISSSCLTIQPRPEIKDPTLLTRDEIEKPEIWAQICVQRVAELAKESTTMRRVLDPMFVYFDSRQHWDPKKGLAMMVLSSMTYFMENSGNQRFIIASVIHHLDHKNVMNDSQLKTSVVQVATSLAMQSRSGKGLAEIGFVGDLCRHLRKSLQASNELVEEQELNLNILLQNSIEDCILEIAKGVGLCMPSFIHKITAFCSTTKLLIFLCCHATLDNYERGRHSEDADFEAEPHHNWVDEVVRCEGRANSIAGTEISSSCLTIQPRPEIKDPTLLTRDEIEKPEIWAQICVQRVAELAKESTTMRRVLDPMFVYFDSRQHWDPKKGLAMMVLSSMTYFMENSGNQRFIIASVIHHLDHKNVMNDSQLKTSVVQVATSLAMQSRSGKGLAEIGFVGDLCRHLRKSLQASNELVEEQELNLNILLQNSIEDCILEIAKGIVDAQPLFDLMAITLDNMPSGVVARATIGSLIILARAVTLALSRLQSQQGFPEALLMQLLKVMLHSDVEARVGAHLIFSVLICPSSFHAHGVSYLRSGYLDQRSKRHSHTASASASIAALLEKLRRGRDDSKTENHGTIVLDGSKGRDVMAEDLKQGSGLKNSPNFYKLGSIMDRATGSPSLTDAEPYVMKLSEDQMSQLLSAFWIQATVPDNLPSNMEAIAHSFIITLMFLRTKKLKDRDNLVIRFFQLPLSLWTMLCDPSYAGMLPPACQRTLLVLSAGMLMFACKIYQIHGLNDVFTSLAISEVDPFLGISDDYQVYAKAHVDVKEYGTAADNQLAMSVLSNLRDKICKCHKTLKDVLVQDLANIVELDAVDVSTVLSETFTPDEEYVFGQQSILHKNQMIYHSLESLSFDGDFPSSSVAEDDTISETSVSDLARFVPKIPASPSVSHVISIGQLMESALEVAGQVAGTAVSTSPLPYNTMARQCETLGTCGRTKLSNWLAFENRHIQAADEPFLAIADNRTSELEKETSDGGNDQVAILPRNPWLAMKLPPASPFDNFLKAARY
ncbi:hypothetical protein TanjilG_15629 [Lupinus angustifolius]|nr:hypothetical protein TanjilG_15629 [Lupinus angustifolius]